MVVILIGYTLFMTSQYYVIFTFANERYGEVCSHSMHIILHALSLLVVQCVTVMNIIYQRSNLGDTEKKTALDAIRTEQFITAKISDNALKQECRTHSVLRRRSSQLQKYKAAR